MSTNDSPASGSAWKTHGWDDHQRGRFAATRGTTLLERLRWLEQASEFARRLSGGKTTPGPASVQEPFAKSIPRE